MCPFEEDLFGLMSTCCSAAGSKPELLKAIAFCLVSVVPEVLRVYALSGFVQDVA